MDWLQSTTGFAFAAVLYFVIHSVLAAKVIKSNFPKQGYRLFYSVFAIVALLFILYLLFASRQNMLLTSSWVVKAFGLLNIFIGLWIIHRTTANYDSKAFLGLKPENYGDLKIEGLNRFVRHPMYYGNFHLYLGIILFYPSEKMIAFSVISIIYIFIGTHLEESKLKLDFGEKYEKYINEVPMFLPINNFSKFYKSLV